MEQILHFSTDCQDLEIVLPGSMNSMTRLLRKIDSSQLRELTMERDVSEGRERIKIKLRSPVSILLCFSPDNIYLRETIMPLSPDVLLLLSPQMILELPT